MNYIIAARETQAFHRQKVTLSDNSLSVSAWPPDCFRSEKMHKPLFFCGTVW
jgi:hypothetical protein